MEQSSGQPTTSLAVTADIWTEVEALPAREPWRIPGLLKLRYINLCIIIIIIIKYTAA